MADSFVFYTERRLVALAGARASNLAELLDGIRTVPGSSIFYHTHNQYLAHHFQKPLFYNDFALWTADVLQEDVLAEQLSAIDLLAFTTVRELRNAITDKVEQAVAAAATHRNCRRGHEFHFCKSQSFIIPTGFVAHSASDLFVLLPRVSKACIYFHFFEARLRLEQPTNDFSHWLRGLGETAMANAIEGLNPYTRTLDELRDDIVRIGRGLRPGNQMNP